MIRQIWRLARRPVGMAQEGDLVFEREELPELQDGQFALAVLYLSLDPTNRPWMDTTPYYMPSVALGEPMRGVVAGEVVASRKDGVAEGEIYFGLGIWSDYVVTDGTGFGRFVPSSSMSIADAFGVFGLVGFAAYFGLLDIGRPEAGETLVMSSAAGGVGQIVGQIGKIKGCRVIGIAGGGEKCRFIIDELGFDAAIDHRIEHVSQRLEALAPDGVDINFEQVGGDIMQDVLSHMRLFGRVPLCGMIATYDDALQANNWPGHWLTILNKRLTVRGFIHFDYIERYPEAMEALETWIAQGSIKIRHDVRLGLDGALASMNDLYTGQTFGKLLVQI